MITSSAAGIKAQMNMAHYSASKYGVVGLMKTLALELAPHGIRVNTIHPTTVDTGMIHWQRGYRLFRPDLEAPEREDVVDAFASVNAIQVPWLQPEEISHAVVYLASDESRYVTGSTMTIDAGATIK